MTTCDRIFAGLILGFILPVAGLCLFWWCSYLLGADVKLMQLCSMIGVSAGLLLTILYIKKLIAAFYSLGVPVMITLYLLYSVGVFGFFMGVPVFNIIPGVLAGFYVGRRSINRCDNRETFRAELKKAALFVSLVLLLACAGAAFLALSDPYTAVNLQGMLMLGPGFTITRMHIWLIALLGGPFLLLLQFWLFFAAGNIAYRFAIDKRPA